ncbi:MAG: TIGR01777 family oxidoreductase [Elusimicrobia bacterium]|nr:TIGR01777 family oxidoreductase [Elusimicrobiota bacterium]
MKILISGATGLIGRPLSERLAIDHEILRLTRHPRGDGDVGWDPASGVVNPTRLDGVDAVVHLAGESIASGRWTESKKRRIRDSRVRGTELLVDALLRLKAPPRVFVGASAIGFYGNRGDEPLDESSPPGHGFLPEVCQAWEAAARPLESKETRITHLRFGVVLSADGGALPQMARPFRFGVGGRLGDGRQRMSWIHLDDAVGALAYLLSTDLRGPVNGTAPTAPTNAEFTATLAKVLHRPAMFPLPRPAARLALGEMAEALLFASARVVPKRLLDAGFKFRWPTLEDALREALRR